METRDRTLRAVVDAIYRSASEPESWPQTLTMLSDAFQATTAGFAFGRRSGGGGISLFIRSDPEWERLYGEYYSHRNPYQRGVHKIRQGLVAAGQSFCSKADLIKTEFYADFLAKQDLLHTLATFPIIHGDTASTVVFYRPPRHHAFGRHEVHLLRLLLPHLALAMRIHEQLAGQVQQVAAANALSAEVPFGVLVLGADGQVRLLNAAADRIIRMNDGLVLSKGQLVAADAAATSWLRRCIRSASTVSANRLVERGGTVTVRRPSLRRPFRLLVAPLDLRDPRASSGALVFLSDPGPPAGMDLENVRAALGVTPREATLVVSLAAGLDLRAFARQSHISIETVRSHLKRVFRKTGVHSQAELLSIILSVPGLDRAGDKASAAD